MERQIITVDISPHRGMVPQLRVSQGDIGRPLGVYIMQDGAALDCSSYSADLYILKSDGNYYVAPATVDSTETNLIIWSTEVQETPVAGECAGQIRIRHGEDDIGTARFVEYVEASPGFSGAGSESAVESIKEYVRQAAASAETASGAASSATGSASAASGSASAAASSASAAAGSASSAHTDAETASQAAQTAQDVAASIPEDYSQLSDDVTSLKSAFEQLDANVITESAGPASIVSIADGADGMPMRSVEVAIEPVQDLHGYDAPWPAGGGANQWNEDWEAYGTSQIKSKTRVPVTAGATYFWCGTIVTAYEFENITDSSIGNMTIQPNSQVTIPSGVNYLMIYSATGYGQTYLNNWALNYPATVTTYSPYSNVCPISGWTGAKVTRTGVNLWMNDDLVLIEGSNIVKNGIDTVTITRRGYQENYNSYRVPVPAVYKIEFDYEVLSTNNASAYVKANMFYIDGTQGTQAISLPSVGYTAHLSFTTNTDKQLEHISFGGWAYEGSVKLTNIFLGFVGTDYAPAYGQKYTVSWQTEAGTVYGGTLDVVSGKLVVDRASIILNGSDGENYTNVSSANGVRIAVPISDDSIVWTDQTAITGKLWCNTFKEMTNSSTFGGAIGIHYRTNGGHSIIIGFGKLIPSDNIYAGVKAWFAQNPTKIVYALAEPQEITLSPTEIKTLLGINNVWADTGNTSVTYPADTKMYIDRKITEAIANALNA